MTNLCMYTCNPTTHQSSRTTNWCDGVVVRTSTLQLVDLGFIPQVESYQKTLNNGIHSFSAWCSANWDSVENKSASLLVLSLGKALNGMAERWQGNKSTRHGCPV